jgi:hypothetical protein
MYCSQNNVNAGLSLCHGFLVGENPCPESAKNREKISPKNRAKRVILVNFVIFDHQFMILVQKY